MKTNKNANLEYVNNIKITFGCSYIFKFIVDLVNLISVESWLIFSEWHNPLKLYLLRFLYVYQNLQLEINSQTS